MASSSSTTNIEADIRLRSASAIHRHNIVIPSHRQLKRKQRAARVIVARRNLSLVVGDDAPDDGEPQSGAGLLPRKIWNEQLVLVLSSNPRPLVRDAHHRPPSLCIIMSR